MDIRSAVLGAGWLAGFAILVAPAPCRGAPAVDSLLAGAAAVEPRGALTMSAALALARLHHPSLRNLAWGVRAAEGRRRDAGRHPNPVLGLDVENVGGSLGSRHRESTVRAEQQLELGGKRGARERVADAQIDLSFAELSQEERSVLAATSERFLDAWTRQRRVDRLVRAERLARQAIEAAGERHRAGAGPAVERVRAEAIHALRQTERVRASGEANAAMHRLVAEWGSTAVLFDSLVLEPPVAVRIPPPAALVDHLDAHPERRRAAAEIAVELARVRDARALRAPDLTLQAGVRHLAEADGAGMVFGVSLPLPLWHRQHGALAAAEAERAAAQARAQLVILRLHDELRTAYERLVAAWDAHDALRASVLPKYEEALRQIAAGYRGGRFSALELLDAQRGVLDTELALIEAQAEAWRARHALERIVGRSLDEIASPEEGR